jgi:Flp pilus assembly protein TadG
MISRSRATSPARTGQALVEFALILVPLLLILAAILQFAFVLGAQVGITNAVREAARNAAAIETDTPALAATNGSATYAQLTGGTGLLGKNVQAYQPGQLVTSGSPITQVCYSTYLDPAGTTQVKVKVEAYYRHPLFIPIISAILDGSDGSSDNALRIGASEEIRIENPPSTTAPTLSSNPQCVTS